MPDDNDQQDVIDPQDGSPSTSVPPPYAVPAAPPEPAAPVSGGPVPARAGSHAAPAAAIGEVRSTGTCILLTIVTLGFYTWYWYYKTHEEMKQHSGQGIGGPIALVLAILVGVVMPFFSSHEVGELYERRGQARPVSAATGLWFLLLGWFFFVGAIIWFVKTNNALNEYWRSLGAEG